MKPEKFKILGYVDKNFRNHNGVIDLMINPESYNVDYSINYNKTGGIKRNIPSASFENFGPKILKFNFVLDGTGVIPGYEDIDVYDLAKKLQDIVYNIKGGKHEPNYLKIVWGVYSFKGRLESYSEKYTLFKPDGTPLRIKIDMSVIAVLSESENNLSNNQNSGKYAHQVIFKQGDNLPLLCKKVYNDPTYCFKVAKFNKIKNIRNISSGTRIVFPPIK